MPDPHNPGPPNKVTLLSSGIDPHKVKRSFARAAGSFDGADFLQTEVRNRLLDRLKWLRLEPQRVLDLGAGTGRALPALAAQFPQAELVALDLTEDMLKVAARREGASPLVVCGNASRLPLVDASVDVVFSSLMVHWCTSLDGLFAEVRRVLRYPGVFSFATLGPGSFRELRDAWQAVDGDAHVMRFPEMTALGNGLLRAGLAEPVIDVETLTICYPDLRQLTSDLRSTGTTNPNSGRSRGLTGRRSWARLEAAYGELRDANGALPVTLEMVFGSVWAKPPAGSGSQLRDGLSSRSI
ncbi:MAG: methyltransferase domain-containing protein [Gammaproteobacteria bacterium]